ncbi:MAG TPA: FAD-dependent oxidoreductase [Armatimonadota bacterium]|nr:FAD-dependent oxidoreductase [Armatimonadota bacterium]
MADKSYDYIIVGANLAGASAVEGIRGVDKEGSILLLGSEQHLPYNRPPLSKKLWFGQKKVEDIFVYDEQFYKDNNVNLSLCTAVVGVDAHSKIVHDAMGNLYTYGKLLLATGGYPKRLTIPGGDLPDIIYYRYLGDYLKSREQASEGKSALVIGGGFIGSELAAALNANKVDVTIIYPEQYIVQRVFPEGLGRAIERDYDSRGIKILSEDVPTSIEQRGNRFLTMTGKGKAIESDMVIVGIGIDPSVQLAEDAGLAVKNGILVNDRLQTSDPNIYAAGDNAFFPYLALDKQVHIEHWDNALNQGLHAGRNMAGVNEPFTYMPYFFSDLFDFGYEAVGDIDSRLDIVTDWQKENDTGVIYYLKDGIVRGVMLCNVWEKLDAAREIIRKGEKMTSEDLRGAIK